MAGEGEPRYEPFDDGWRTVFDPRWQEPDKMDGSVPVNQRGFPPIVAQAFVVGGERVSEVGVVGLGDDEVRVSARQVPVGVGFVNMGSGKVGVRPMLRTKEGGRLHGQDFPVVPMGGFLSEVGGGDPTALQESAGEWGRKKQTPVTVVYEVGGVTGLPIREDDLVRARGGDPEAVVDEGKRAEMSRAARVKRFRESQGGE